MACFYKTKRRKKGLTSVQEEERYRVVTVDEKVRLLDTVHKDPAGGHSKVLYFLCCMEQICIKKLLI